MKIHSLTNHLTVALFLFLFSTIATTAQSYEELKDKVEKAYNAGDVQTALQYAEQAVKAYPSNPEANHNYGYLASFLVDKNTGLKYLDKAIAAAPDSINWLYSRAQVLHFVANDYKASNTDLKVYEKKSTQPETSYLMMADNYRQLGELDNAMLYVEKIEDSGMELTPDFYYTKTDILMSKREYMLAIQAATQAIQLQPDAKEHYFMRGLSFFKAFKYEYAIKDYDKYLTLAPDDDLIYALRGDANIEINKLDAAYADYSKAIQLNDQNDIAYLGRADYYRLKEQNEKAIADLKKAQSISPNKVKVYGKLGMVYLNMANFANSIQAYTKAIQLDPKDGTYYTSRSYAYLKTEVYDKALADAKKGLQLMPGFSDAYLHGGLALFNLNRFSEALEFVTEGLQENPANGMLYYLRSSIHKELGNTSAAQADDAKAKQLLTKS